MRRISLPLGVLLSIGLCALALAGGCGSELAVKDQTVRQAAAPGVRRAPGGPSVRGVNLNDTVRFAPHDEPIVLAAAKNEWTSFALQLDALPRPDRKRPLTLRIRAPLRTGGSAGETIPASQFAAHQIIALPVDVNRAGYVRHTGRAVEMHELPRALLPVRLHDGIVRLSSLRNPNAPADPRSRASDAPADEPLLLWVDLHVPPETRAGTYTARCEIVQTGERQPLASVDVRLTVFDFVIPDERHLNMVARLDWDDLLRLYPDKFETVRPPLLNRTDPQYGPTIRTLDQLVALAQRHRTQVVVPRLQPLVKWHPTRPPQVSWADLDSIIGPWMSGEAFGDRIPLGYWPLPAIDLLGSYPPAARMQYWSEAAVHFDRHEWLERAAVFVEKLTPGRAGTVESLQLSAEAAQILGVHPRLRVAVPLEDDQIQLAGTSNRNLIEPQTTGRLLAAAPELVFASPLQPWPAEVTRPQRWMRTDLPGLVPYAGAGGDEHDVRVWAWLAFLRQASLILWGSPLPQTNSPAEPADPNDLTWFYPGEWFGLDEPVPTVQLKWLRRAQQDYEYLWLARQRGEVINALLMARLMTKPVEIQPNQSPDPTYALMCGTTDPTTWSEAMALLTRSILLREPGQTADSGRRSELNLQMLRWAEPQERPVLMGRATQWLIDAPDPMQPGEWTSLRLGIDVYNASDMRPDENLLQWTSVPASGWQVPPQPVRIPALAMYRVQRFNMDARYNIEQIGASNGTSSGAPNDKPIELTFTDGFSQRQTKVQVVLPVAASDRRNKPGLLIDGKLGDWDAADALQRGPLVRMFSRPAVRAQQIQRAATPAEVYSCWADEHFYLAFKLGGTSGAAVTQTRNFVEYQFRRAWGEDLAEILIQPVYADNTLGPVLHVVCKPTGTWVERKTADTKRSVDPWQPFEGTGVRYMARMDPAAGEWRGEVAIPWSAIVDEPELSTPGKGRPKMLRFNFAQHRHETGESATWAGPVDFGRDDALTGLVYLREPEEPGMGGR